MSTTHPATRRSHRWFVAVALALAGPAALAPHARAGTAADAAAAKALDQAKKQLEQCFDHALDEFKAAVKQAKADYTTGVLNDDFVAIRTLGDLSDFNLSLQAHRTWVTFQLLQKLSEIGQFGDLSPDAILVGAGGVLDEWLEYSAERYFEVFAKSKKPLKKLRDFVQQQTQGTKRARVQGLPQAPPPEAPGNPKSAAKRLAITALGSTDSPQVPNDGKLFVAGEAPAAGGQVVVKIHGPNGESLTQTVTAGADGVFQATFPAGSAGGAGSLAEGNWRIEATAGGQLATAAHGI